MTNQNGFTLLELMVTIAIIGAVFVVGSMSGMGNWSQKKTSQNTVKELRDELANTRNYAMTRNVTGRLNIVVAGDTYTMTMYTSDVATSTCDSTGTWNTIMTRPLDVHATYQITGTAIAAVDTCFFRDGSASTARSFTIEPKVGQSGTTTTMDIIPATGFLDVY